MKTIKRTALSLIAIVVIYVCGGIILSDLVFPQSKVDYTNYFKPGDKLISKAEGFEQTVIGISDGWLHTRLEAGPYAPGPPVHYHEHFEETFTVKSGTLSVYYNGEKKTLRAGETLTIPRLTLHKPFNETGDAVLVESEDTRTLPVQFGYHLSQLYGFLDKDKAGTGLLDILFQFSVYGDELDTWIADGPPLIVQKAMRTVMAPTARLLGYKNYYPEYSPKHGQ